MNLSSLTYECFLHTHIGSFILKHLSKSVQSSAQSLMLLFFLYIIYIYIQLWIYIYIYIIYVYSNYINMNSYYDSGFYNKYKFTKSYNSELTQVEYCEQLSWDLTNAVI